MATFKEFSPQDIKTTRSSLEQIVDILQNDISGSTTRRKSQLFVTGGIGPGITSSLFQTVYDQDFTLQTANPMLDVTFCLSKNSGLVTGSVSYTDATTGMFFFPSQSVMMREKMDIYQEMAQILLGNADSEFTMVSGSSTATIREPFFICFKRLFARDGIKRETFALKMYKNASALDGVPTVEKIYTDVGSSNNQQLSVGGQVSTIVDSSDTTAPVGLLYLDRGVAVLDTQRVFNITQNIAGTIKAMSPGGTNPFNSTINNLFVSGCIDDVLDHICSVHLSSSDQTAIVFKNDTILNSTLYFCNFGPDDFNYSSNPTYRDSNNRIVVIDPGQEDSQKTFTFITAIGGYDAHNNPLWVAKTSRPVFKDFERSFPLKIRLDF